MANEVTLSGSISDPELRFTNNGTKVTTFSVKVLGYAKKGQERPTNYIDVVVWGDLGENVAESLQKGDRVLVTGELKQEKWEKDGEKRSKLILVARVVGADLTYATVAVTRTERSDGPSNVGGGGLADF